MRILYLPQRISIVGLGHVLVLPPVHDRDVPLVLFGAGIVPVTEKSMFRGFEICHGFLASDTAWAEVIERSVRGILRLLAEKAGKISLLASHEGPALAASHMSIRL